MELSLKVSFVGTEQRVAPGDGTGVGSSQFSHEDFLDPRSFSKSGCIILVGV